MTFELDEESIVKASSQFWEQMLSMQLKPAELGAELMLCNGDVVGCVLLNGAWNGCIEIVLCGGLAITATAAMLMQPAETVTQSDALDAAKEIANMIAGTIKSALPRPCNMAVPQSGLFPEAIHNPRHPVKTQQVTLTHETGKLLIRVIGAAAA